jgi:flavin reductase (DIM6/NTAB) family NADH-FMN oxidoreductase RutF
MTISPQAYRDALRHFPSGVTVVTLSSGGRIHGLTVSAFASVSPEPPLVAILIDHQHGAHTLLERPEAVFAVNVLAEDQRELSDTFAWKPDDQRFSAGTWTTAVTGAPVLVDALAWLDCTIHSRHVAGTHTLYVGRVVASGTPRADGLPLVYWNRDYRRLAHGVD